MSEMGLPFAMALLDLSTEQGREEEWLSQLQQMAALMKNEPDYLLALNSPGISRDTKKQWLKELFHDQIDETLEDMLMVAVDHDAAGQMPAIAEHYQSLYEARQGIVPVTVTSASAMDADQKIRLKNKLERQLKAPVRLTFTTDPSLMGGMVIRTPNLLQDLSVKGRLESMKEQLHRE